METVLEIIVDFLFDGLIEFVIAQETPKTVRGICFTVLTAIMLGVGGFCGYYAIAEADNIAVRVLLGCIALFLLAGCIGFLWKVNKKRKSENKK